MVTRLTGPRIKLQQGVVYRARLRLDDMIECMAPLSAVADAFRDLGFSDVRVWDDKDDLPADWPPTERQIDTAWTSCGRWLEGTWALAPTEIQKPEQILSVWEHARPTGPPAPPIIPEPPPRPPGPPAPPRPDPKPPTQPSSCSIRGAAVTLARAWGAEGLPANELTESVTQILLGTATFEGGLGCGKYGGKVINNWGAVHCPIDHAATERCRAEGKPGCIVQRDAPGPDDLWMGCHVAKDTNRNGKYPVGFRVYATSELGCRDYLRQVLRRKGVKPALEAGDVHGYARAMYESSYYGDTPESTGEARIREYARAVRINAKKVAKALGQKPAFDTSSGNAPLYVVMGVVGAAAVIGGTYYYVEHVA